MKCPVCGEGECTEVIEDAVGAFGTVLLGAKHSKCDNCQFTGFNGTQNDYNKTCELIELHGPFKPVVIDDVFKAHLYFGWIWQNFGFGQFSLHYDPETNKLTCNDEYIGRENVRKLLYAFADHVAKHAVMDGDEE